MTRVRSVALTDYKGNAISDPDFERFLQRTGFGLLKLIKLARIRKKQAGDKDKQLTDRLKKRWPETVRTVIVGNGRNKYTGDMRASLTTKVIDPVAFLRELGSDANTVVEGIQLPVAWLIADPQIIATLFMCLRRHMPDANIQIEDLDLVLNSEAFKTYLDNRSDPLPEGLVGTAPKSRSLYIDRA